MIFVEYPIPRSLLLMLYPYQLRCLLHTLHLHGQHSSPASQSRHIHNCGVGFATRNNMIRHLLIDRFHRTNSSDTSEWIERWVGGKSLDHKYGSYRTTSTTVSECYCVLGI
jgi:hypothetical protein